MAVRVVTVLARLRCSIGWHRAGRLHGQFDNRKLARCRACNRKLYRNYLVWRVDRTR